MLGLRVKIIRVTVRLKEWAMKKPGIVLSAILCWSGAASAEAPFAPFPNAVDYVVTMVTKQHGRESGERVVTHHAGWARVDTMNDGHRTISYFDRADTIELSFARGSSGNYVHLSIL